MDAAESNKKPFKIKDVTRNIKKAIVASTLEEIKTKVAEKFEKIDIMPTIHLDSDGTEVDDEEYFRTLEPNTELIAAFPGEHWIDPTQFVTISSHHQKKSLTNTTDTTDAAAVAESDRIKKLVGQIKNNLCNVSVMSDSDLDSLSNMDPNSLVDITGKDFVIDQLKDTTGRAMHAKREAEDRINLLKLLIEDAITSKTSYQNVNENSDDGDNNIRKNFENQQKIEQQQPSTSSTTNFLDTQTTNGTTE